MYLYRSENPQWDEMLRLKKDVPAITNEQIVEISKLTRTSHQIVTRVMRATAEAMIKLPAKGAEAEGCRTQPYFWYRWDPKYWSPVTFAIESGSISESLTDETSRSLQLTCHSDHWTTFEEFQYEVSPFHTLLRVERGVRAAAWTSKPTDGELDTSIRWVPLGIYRVHKVNFDRDHTASIEAYSMEQILKDYLYETPPLPLATANTSWIRLLEEKFLPGGLDKAGQMDWSYVTWEIRDSITPAAQEKVASEKYQPGLQIGNSFTRWTGIADQLEQRHFRLYVNRVGKPIVVRVPEPFDSVNPDYVSDEIQNQLIMDEGGSGNIINRSEDFNRDGMFNMVVAYGEIAVDNPADGQAASKPVSVIRTDDNPASLTYIGGPFGRIGKELQVENVMNVDKVTVAAEAELSKSKILTTRSNLSLLPNPTIEVGDRIQVHYPDGSYRWFVIETAEIPLTSDAELSVSAYTYDNARVDINVHPPKDVVIVPGSVTDDAVTLNFTAAEGAVGYEWSSDATLFWNPIVTKALPKNKVEMVITGLMPLINYRIKIRSVVSENWVASPLQEDGDITIVRTAGTMLVAEAGWPGRFLGDMIPVNIPLANLFSAFHVLPAPNSTAQVNDPWPNDVYVTMADGMSATWTGGRFVQRI